MYRWHLISIKRFNILCGVTEGFENISWKVYYTKKKKKKYYTKAHMIFCQENLFLNIK